MTSIIPPPISVGITGLKATVFLACPSRPAPISDVSSDGTVFSLPIGFTLALDNSLSPPPDWAAAREGSGTEDQSRLSKASAHQRLFAELSASARPLFMQNLDSTRRFIARPSAVSLSADRLALAKPRRVHEATERHVVLFRE